MVGFGRCVRFHCVMLWNTVVSTVCACFAMMKLIAELKCMTQNRNCHAVYVTQAKNGMQNAKKRYAKKGYARLRMSVRESTFVRSPVCFATKHTPDDTDQSGYRAIPAYHCVKIANTTFRLVQSWYLWFSGSSSWWIFRVWNRNPKPSGLQIVSVLFLLLLGNWYRDTCKQRCSFPSHPSVWHQ